jgi:hypothetical protein
MWRSERKGSGTLKGRKRKEGEKRGRKGKLIA